MYTKPLAKQVITTVHVSNDVSEIGRLLLAAALSPQFCERLLNDPEDAVEGGFGSERFHITEGTLKIMAAIREITLPDFIRQLDSGLGNRLLMSESIDHAT
jgi:hypothetical protein